MINVEKTIISQYSNSPTLVELIKNINEYIDPRADLNQFYDYVWNIDTAQGFGLDIWGKIVGVSRNLKVPKLDNYFGFDNQSKSYKPFNQGIFRDPSYSIEGTVTLDDNVFRKLILVKALSNISSSNAPSINMILNKLFANRGRCYVNDSGKMSIRYVFEFKLELYELAIIENSGVLLRPSGVKSSVFINPKPNFGFKGGGNLITGFDQAPFMKD